MKRFGTKFILVVFAVLAWAVIVQAATPTSERITVEAEGSGPTKMAALQQAWMEAVHKAVGLFLTSKTEMIDDDLTEKIVTHSRGQVNSYKVLSEVQNGDIWIITIQASIDRDILQETVAQSQSQKMTLDASDVVAKEATEAEKKASQSEILSDALNNLDLGKILRYQTKLKKTQQNGKTVFYVEHTLSIDPEKFKIMAGQLEKTIAPVASGKDSHKYYEPFAKSLAAGLKNWTYTPEALYLNRFLYNQFKDNMGIEDMRFYNPRPAPNSIYIYKNPNKAESYSFSEQSIFYAMEKLYNNYELSFEVEGGEDFSEITDRILFKWPDRPTIRANVIYIDPVFRSDNDRSQIMTIRYNQQLNLTPEQMLEIKEITGKYSLIKK